MFKVDSGPLQTPMSEVEIEPANCWNEEHSTSHSAAIGLGLVLINCKTFWMVNPSSSDLSLVWKESDI